ncbi:hypothetical protein M011DRAFT_458414 [Sporormia fimetaria CBS 119925]|uniref:Uncharacterized protein n=1 Tax=Sporormia fimetaria CBS 119925 TaxID=1340428 RepID=A0A6A6VDA2_9PLEO|nr:hypothetical protein M011DRAFT_458414 [Sporormia fimetaria CBS 119925]
MPPAKGIPVFPKKTSSPATKANSRGRTANGTSRAASQSTRASVPPKSNKPPRPAKDNHPEADDSDSDCVEFEPDEEQRRRFQAGGPAVGEGNEPGGSKCTLNQKRKHDAITETSANQGRQTPKPVAGPSTGNGAQPESSKASKRQRQDTVTGIGVTKEEHDTVLQELKEAAEKIAKLEADNKAHVEAKNNLQNELSKCEEALRNEEDKVAKCEAHNRASVRTIKGLESSLDDSRKLVRHKEQDAEKLKALHFSEKEALQSRTLAAEERSKFNKLQLHFV